jgi:hypothetical protein
MQGTNAAVCIRFFGSNYVNNISLSSRAPSPLLLLLLAATQHVLWNGSGNERNTNDNRTCIYIFATRMSCCVPQEHSFLDERLAKWQEIQLRRETERVSIEEVAITITLPDGSTRPGVAGKTTPMDIAKGISSGLAKKVMIAKVDDALWDLGRALQGSCALQLLDFDTPEGKHTFWHSAAHVLGQALEIEENAHLCSG